MLYMLPVMTNKKKTLPPDKLTTPSSVSPWLESIELLADVKWRNVLALFILPGVALLLTPRVPLTQHTLLFSLAYYFCSALGITAGYHRLWAHQSYRASFPLKCSLAVFGAAAGQGSIRWWCHEHRAHHRYTDTSRDPYSVHRGLFYSHCGWLLLKSSSKGPFHMDIRDLENDVVVKWQSRNYVWCFFVMGFVVPAVICGFGWTDWFGGILYAGILRVFFLQQATFCVNSLAHWVGSQPYSDKQSPHDHVVTSLITLGEGYHNFHHEFPSDYRNGVRWYQYDPTKWAIAVWGALGLASHLKRFPRNEIEMGRVQQLQKAVDRQHSQVQWGVPIEQLPVISWEDYICQVKAGKCLVAISGVLYDVQCFVKGHPGGAATIGSAIGTDATAVFNGGIYDHSNAAHNLLSKMRYGLLRGGLEMEVSESRRAPVTSKKAATG